MIDRRFEQLSLLYPPLATRVLSVLTQAAARGIDVHPFETWRTWQRQAHLKATGKTAAGAWQSWHQYGLAVDLVGGGPRRWTWDGIDWDALGEIGKDAGLIWGGEFRNPDRPHFQWPTTVTMSEIQRAYMCGGVLHVWSLL